jgi:glycosyltransferase involved in cell wall biosynthesis
LSKDPELEKTQVAVIMPVHNEEDYVRESLNSILEQDLKPYRIIVMNDGSTDDTLKILKEYEGIEVVNLPQRTSKDMNLTLEICKVINSGLDLLKNEKDCDFIMKMDADHLLPKDYLSKIIKKMLIDPKIMACSGVIEGEYFVVPVHSGRVYRYDYLDKFGLEYPVKFSSEDYLLLKAQSLGFKVEIFSDIVTKVLRKTRSNYYDPTGFYNYGRGMKALGYAFPYVFLKSLAFGVKNPKNGIYMLKGFFAKNIEKFEPEFREYVKKTQYKAIFRPNKEYLKRWSNLTKS